jgi:shikimate kinase
MVGNSRPIAVFIGMPASGKSKIAKRVAKRLDAPLIDVDKVIVADHGEIVDIFDTHGEAHFRALEREAVKKALATHSVVSLGGGAILNVDTQHDLASLPVVLLTVSEAAVADRFGDRKRPLLRGGLDAWRKLTAERTEIYERLADVSFDTSSRPLDQIADEIADWVRAGYTVGGSA